jgi:flagellar motor switch/type III secretory pathway protein FliN
VAAEAAAHAASKAEKARAPAAATVAPQATTSTTTPIAIDQLPPYARSLMQIAVPVTVTLARKKQPLSQIVDLSVGSIIHFQKSCEEMIHLEVGNEPVAEGEPVKVGDKFGIRIMSMSLPPADYLPVQAKSSR